LERFYAAEGIEEVRHQITRTWTLAREYRLLARGVIVMKDGVVKYVEYVHEITNELNYEKALAVVKDLS
jgi:thiol peroxidase